MRALHTVLREKWRRGVVVRHVESQHRVLIPPCVTFKAPLVRKATGNHLINSTSLEETHSPVSGSATLQINYAKRHW